MKTRIYIVTTPTGKRLIEAANSIQAVNYVARQTITAKANNGREAIDLINQGVKLESIAPAGAGTGVGTEA